MFHLSTNMQAAVPTARHGSQRTRWWKASKGPSPRKPLFQEGETAKPQRGNSRWQVAVSEIRESRCDLGKWGEGLATGRTRDREGEAGRQRGQQGTGPGKGCGKPGVKAQTRGQIIQKYLYRKNF